MTAPGAGCNRLAGPRHRTTLIRNLQRAARPAALSERPAGSQGVRAVVSMNTAEIFLNRFKEPRAALWAAFALAALPFLAVKCRLAEERNGK